MRASVLREGRMVYRDDVPDPVPGPGQVLVAVRSCGICGTDLHFAAHGDEMLALSDQLAGSMGAGAMKVDLNNDVFMGHEFSAEVLEAGPDTDTHPPGTLVASIPVLLSSGGVEPILCSNSTLGGFAERMLLSAPLLLPIPNGLDAQTRRVGRTHGRRAARRKQIEYSAWRNRIGARLWPDRHRHHRGATCPRCRNHCGRGLYA